MEISRKKRSHVSNAATLIFSYEWTIENFHMCTKTSGEFIKSPIFSFENCDYSIRLYPSGHDRDCNDNNWISIFLKTESKSDFNKELLFCFSYFNSKKEIEHSEKAEDNLPDCNRGYGINFFIKRDDIYNDKHNGKILHNNALTVLCNFYQEPSMEIVIDDENAIDFQKCKNECSLHSNLQALLNNKTLTDVKLVVNGKKFPAHKLILTARSPVFAAILENEMKEKTNPKIEIEDVEVDVIEKMLEFMYTDKVTNMDDFHLKLLYVAQKYDIKGLKLACEEFTYKNLTVDNAVEAFIFSERYHCEVLKPKVLKFIIKNAKKMIDHSEFDVRARDLPLSIVDVIKAMA